MRFWLNSRVATPRWHPCCLAAGLAMGLLILASWAWPASHALWATLDAKVFYFLNGSLTDNRPAQFFWAVANHRVFDLVPALLVLSIYLHYMWSSLKTAFWESVAIGLFMTLLVLVAFQTAHLLSGDRMSPSLTLEPVNRLSQLVPEINPKDSSKNSFPGDHALVLFIVSICIWFFTGPKRGFLAVFISSLEIFPRLVGGAHWFTDIFVGALSTALIATSIALATPLYAPVCRWFYRKLEQVVRPRIPLGWG